MSAGRERLRQQLAEALPFIVDQLFDGPHEYPTWEQRLRTADALLAVVETYAAQKAAEELGEALGEAATLGPLEAVAWMARRRAALSPATEKEKR